MMLKRLCPSWGEGSHSSTRCNPRFILSLLRNHGYLYVLKVAKSKDMVHTAKYLLSLEKGWLLSQIGKGG